MADSPAALHTRATQSLRAGRFADAIDAYEQMLALQPGRADDWYNLAFAQHRARRFDAALASYQTALDLGVDGPEEVHLNRAAILAGNLGRSGAAEVELHEALRHRPGYAPALVNLGNLHEQRGDREQALAAYEAVLLSQPGHAVALSRLANLRRLSDPADPLIARLRSALSRQGASWGERADLGFALGKALDDVRSYDEAFAAYSRANEASRRSAPAPGPRYDAARQERHVEDLMFAFGQPARASEAPPRKPPVFICGMFRSGSTLIEQILARAPRVTAGGEIDLLPALVHQELAGHLAQRRPIDDALVERLRAAYIDGITGLFPEADVLTDKRPDNFLHIGIIKRLFPDAKILHTTRHPLDNGLSVYFLHLSHAMPYALDLRDIGHWHGQYRRLMAHWKSLYGEDIHDVDYDRLVVQPRPVIEAALAHCGLPWSDACLEFHAGSSPVATPSAWQVRQPLYQRSSGRWRHYERHLGPLREALGPLPE